jgi:hypothetical protein
VLTLTPPTAEKPKRRRTTTGNTTPKKKKATKPTEVLQEQTQGSGVASPSSGPIHRSLWDQTDWSKVPDDDPTKQLAMAEARRQQGMQIRYVQPSLEDAQTEAPTGSSAATPNAQGTTKEEQKQKKRIDWSQVDE